MQKNSKKIPEEQLKCPWTSNYGFVIDHTFASRLFSFLSKIYKDVGSLPPGFDEEYEYLLRSASKLKIWQMGVPSELNENYFNNLKNIKTDPKLIKYLSNIGCPNAFDIDKYLNKIGTNISIVEPRYDQAYIAVNPTGEYRIFEGKPYRSKEKIMVRNLDEIEEDYHGREYHPWKWNGEFKDYWVSNHSCGAYVNKECLPAAYQNMSWEDEPKAM